MASYDYAYEGDHDIRFWKYVRSGNSVSLENNPKRAWSTFGLIPSTRPSVVLPTVNYSIVQIPGTNSRLDITEYLPGGKTYNNRSGSWSFAAPVTPDYENWKDRYHDIQEYFDGSRFVVELMDDPGVYYEGRLSASNYEPGSNYSTVTINYDLDPLTSDTF